MTSLIQRPPPLPSLEPPLLPNLPKSFRHPPTAPAMQRHPPLPLPRRIDPLPSLHRSPRPPPRPPLHPHQPSATFSLSSSVHNPPSPDSDESEDSTPLLISSAPSSPVVHSPSQARLSPFPEGFTPTSPSSLPPSPSYKRLLVPCFSSKLWCPLLTLTASVLLFIFLIFPRIVLFATTGSVLYHPYDYYTSMAAAQRLYPRYFNADGSYSEKARNELALWPCPAPSQHPPIALHSLPPPSPSSVIDVHIVTSTDWTLFPFLWDSILVNHTWLHPTLRPTPISCTASHDCHRCDNQSNADACERWFPDQGIRVTLLNWPLDVMVLPSVRTLVIVGENMEPHIFGYLKRADIAPFVSPYLQVVALMLTGEECNSYQPSYESLRQSLDDRLTYTMQTYGDCRLNAQWNDLNETTLPSSRPVDVLNPIAYWPLGPKTISGFPSRLPEQEVEGNEDEVRPLLLNLQVSINQEKATRMQTWLVTTEYCRSLPSGSCYIHNNDFTYSQRTHPIVTSPSSFYRCVVTQRSAVVWLCCVCVEVVSVIENYSSIPLRSLPMFANPTSTEYLPLLTSSTFTLCPAGKNPEQYRIWEAMMAGSIPIIEDPTVSMTPSMHSAYAASFRCTPLDVHRVLKKYKAPVIFIKDWRELPSLLNGMGEKEVAEKRREIKRWFRELKVELRRELLERVKYLHGRK